MLRNEKPVAVVVADDFGLTRKSTLAIVEAFEKELITVTSIATNMPPFELACNLAQKHGFLNRIGLHLNLTSGFPLTNEIRNMPRLCDTQGKFTRRKYRLSRLSQQETTCLYREIHAQFERCLEAGISPISLDSHHHIHFNWSINKIVRRVAVERKIKFVRLANNCTTRLTSLYSWHFMAINGLIRKDKLTMINYFGEFPEVRHSFPHLKGNIEIMVHPQLDDRDGLFDYSPKQPLCEVGAWIRENTRMMTFRELISGN